MTFAALWVLIAAIACPKDLPATAAERRELAGRWFERGRKAQLEERHLDAQHAFACSMRITPHAFTAFNLARAAEDAGDLDLAASSYRTYLQLSPRAKDRRAVEAKIAKLESELERLREQAPAPIAEPQPEPQPEPLPEPAGPEAAAAPEPPPEPAPLPKPTQIAQPPLAVIETPVPPDTDPKIGAWVTVAGGAALLVAGTILNAVAHSRADESRRLWNEERFQLSDDAHHEAGTFAITSYVGFGLGGAALIGGGILLLAD